jgi:stearoyl-CoA desaturase (delta-9 desaturase)
LALPSLLGWLFTGTVSGALAALVWAGGVSIFVLHHVTWAVNSVGHMFGTRPFRTRDNSTNFALLALLSFGDSWHNSHHAYPRLARHGTDPGQIDTSALLIRCLEHLHLASDVNWATEANTAPRRRPPQPGSVLPARPMTRRKVTVPSSCKVRLIGTGLEGALLPSG